MQGAGSDGTSANCRGRVHSCLSRCGIHPVVWRREAAAEARAESATEERLARAQAQQVSLIGPVRICNKKGGEWARTALAADEAGGLGGQVGENDLQLAEISLELRRHNHKHNTARRELCGFCLPLLPGAIWEAPY